ncbi:HSF5 protein, partial [Vireo altiloquus]|nr:HSF5 protein [Vireo altiloquus]
PVGLTASTFPTKLWRLASSPHVRSVRWDGRATGLLIHRALFEHDLLSPAPHTFRALWSRSIVHQLNYYGFYKVPGWVSVAVPGNAEAWLHYSN